MDDWYLQRIEQKKKGNMEVYKEALIEVYGEEVSWTDVKNGERDKQIELMVTLDNTIKLKESPIDIKKMARAIQSSRSGAGGCAMTNFICVFCGTEELWSNTATPKICMNCATKMATNMAKYLYKDVLKKEYRYTQVT